MEYIVSARKYRPMSFDSVVGQTALTTTLKNAVKTGKLAHAYLFCGPRGVGKTTCARIFARAINCQTPTADGEACGNCESCRSFEEQRSYNIFELDAASNNSVEDIKTLMEQTRIPPQVGRYKVFIIDEVHMLSTQAFNAFLKTLEEPPAHVVFILATTEKHKLLPTIISRCQIYDFERMTVQNTINHLKMVAEKEGVTYEEEALATIAEKADGGMRDALSIFDQVASFCQGNITYDKTIEDLNVLDSENYFKIVDCSLENKVSDVMLLLNNVLSRGFDGGHLCNGLASHIRNVMMAKDPQTMQLLEVSAQQKAKYVEQAKKCPPIFLYQALRILNQCDVNYRQSSNKRLLVELTLIQVAQITQPEDDATGSGRSPKRLKTLFKNIVRQAQPVKAVQQVTATESAVTGTSQKEVSRNGLSSTEGHTTPTTKPASAPKLKLGNLGTTFASMRRANSNENNENETGENSQNKASEESVNKVFEQNDLEKAWLLMCNRMQLNIEYKALATRMKNIYPELTDFPKVVVRVENQLLLDSINPMRKRILATLKKDLQNQNIELDLQLIAMSDIKVAMTKPQAYKKLIEDNNAFSDLVKEFELELT